MPATPTSLAFVHGQNTTLHWQTVTMTGTNWKIIGKPNFTLQSDTIGVVMQTIGSGASSYQTVSGSGDAIVLIKPTAFYNQDISFSSTDLASTFEILAGNVHLAYINWTMEINRVSDFAFVPYSPGIPAFTLDPKYIEVISSNSDTYFQIGTAIVTYHPFTGDDTEAFVPQKIVLFQGKARFNLGELIHRLMQVDSDTFNFEVSYQLTTLTLVFQERSLTDDELLREAALPLIPFIAGLSSRFITGAVPNVGFLDVNPKPNRGTLTSNGFAILNFYCPLPGYEIRFYKNGNVVNNWEISYDTSATQSYVDSFYNSGYKKGDVIEYVLDINGEVNEDAPRKTYIMLPEGLYSYMIFWDNEFLLRSVLECTGTASIKSDFEVISQKTYHNLIERLEYLSSSKEVRLSINTGWLLRTDVDTVESLLRSKSVWITIGNDTIALRPTTKTMINQDLQRELIEFSLEFIINRNYNEETYSL